MRPPFKNEPFTDFTNDENIQSFQAALDKVRGLLGQTYPAIINGERIETGDLLTSVNPANHSEVIGKVHRIDQELAETAINSANAAFKDWSRTKAEDRAYYAWSAADIMRQRKHEFSAWMVLEEGKSWAEADGDTAEAIDFLEFYGHEAVRYGGSHEVLQYPGEKNEVVYIPLGVGVVIPPWNFPLAILVGMTTAAFVTGNTVVLKPSSESPVIGAMFMRLLEDIGLPPGVVNFCPGSGSKIGDFLVKHPLTRFISFTGSKEVGLGIVEKAAKAQDGQIWIKRIVAEMGGKDSMLICHDADLDSAADGIVKAAFGFQGQKCSACSRAIIDASVYDEVVEKVVTIAKELTVGSVEDLKNFMGPVISASAYKDITAYVEIGKKEGELVLGGDYSDETGWFVQPTIIKDIAPDARISQEEIFGPVLAIIKAKDLDDGIDIFNNTEYGLTGAVYSASRETIERCKQECHVGNFYINRKCTGALVGVHPFGGFNMSGTDSKAGGRDYLLLFLQAKSIAEVVTQ